MIKKLISILLILFLIFTVFAANSVEAVTRVNGYYRKNGTYVAPYFRSDRNSTKFDNYSTKGNINPYTGKKGTVNIYKFRY